MANEPVQKSVEDILHLQSTKFQEHSQILKELIESLEKTRDELESERKEVHQLKELCSDMIAESDRLSQRMSTHLKAMIEIVKRLERNT